MSKLAHSDSATMEALEFQNMVEDGNQSLAEGFYWGRLKGEAELRIGEFRQVRDGRHGGITWEWDLTRGQVAHWNQFEVVQRLSAPAP